MFRIQKTSGGILIDAYSPAEIYPYLNEITREDVEFDGIRRLFPSTRSRVKGHDVTGRTKRTGWWMGLHKDSTSGVRRWTKVRALF